jgi:hypothetical protein
MRKVKVKVITLGHMPPHVDLVRILAWRSQVFEIIGPIENHEIRCNSDGIGWEFSDSLISEQIPPDSSVDFVFALTNVPLDMNWYSRRIGQNRAVLTFHEIKDYLRQDNIPLENLVLRVLYAYTLLFVRSGNKIPNYIEATSYTHDETRGCLYDMNGVKSDIVESCVTPIVCGECQERLKNQHVSNNVISAVQSEIKKIRKTAYFRALDFVRHRPIAALAISSTFALIIGTAGSILASYIYEAIKAQ